MASEMAEVAGRLMARFRHGLWGTLFGALVLGTVLGCRTSVPIGTGTVPTYSFQETTRISTVSFAGVLQASSAVEISVRDDAWGVIRWLPPEGKVVASGEAIVEIDMTILEDEERNTRADLRHAQERLETHSVSDEIERLKLENEFRIKRSELSLREEERRWLLAGKADDERWKIETEYRRSLLEASHSASLLRFQREVDKRGFDAPFTLRKMELEMTARDLEVDYNRRRVERLSAGPMAEELARAGYQIDVASGERWLSERSMKSGLASRDITRKSLQFQVESKAVNQRNKARALAQRRICAPMPGLVVFPLLWGGQKAEPGMDIWEGVGFLKVVSTGSYQLEAAVDETVSAVLKPGVPASVTIDAYPTTVLPGRVLVVGKVARRERGRGPSDFKRFPIQVAVEVGTLPVRLGMKAMITVPTAGGSGIFLPRDLVQGENGSTTVRLVGFTGISTRAVKIEPFDSDLVKWLDPPSRTGELAY